MAPYNLVKERIEELEIIEPIIDPVVIEPKIEIPYYNKDEIAEIIRSYSVKDRIGCAKLRQVAKDIGLPSRQLGAIAKEYNIKIVACELGCF